MPTHHRKGQEVQRVEHQRGERRVRELQRHRRHRRVIDEVVEPAVGQRRGTVDVDVKVDEVGAVGPQVGERDPQHDAQQK
jgi:hypothetical protein